MANDKQHYLSKIAIGQYNLALWFFAGSIFKSFHPDFDNSYQMVLDKVVLLEL